ncbi:unnamed protein product [Candida verbasci]|uniref:Clathrin light chain n=1 Tax=Candida verbasci TaxID=1227364 RepID=A0A9W4TYS6_9ASCO|nr:unnamed protein product [Candida verbasci]
MADKFPEIETEGDLNNEFSSDFLSREKEVLGDEFTTDQDKQVYENSEDDEINEFKEQFPQVENNEEQQPQTQNSDDEFEGFESSKSNDVDLSSSQPIKEWKHRRDLEIQQREKVNEKKKNDILEKAQSTIDDFYENYNLKKENHSKDLKKEIEEFISKRDNFLKNGTLWDRVNELIDNVGELPETDDTRDKSKFKELLKKLKGKDNVPGAAGYA